MKQLVRVSDGSPYGTQEPESVYWLQPVLPAEQWERFHALDLEHP